MRSLRRAAKLSTTALAATGGVESRPVTPRAKRGREPETATPSPSETGIEWEDGPATPGAWRASPLAGVACRVDLIGTWHTPDLNCSVTAASEEAAQASVAFPAGTLAMTVETRLWAQGERHVVGVDEAGRGPLAGPVVAAAVSIIPPPAKRSKGADDVSAVDIDPPVPGVHDSKLLTEEQREQLFSKLVQHPRVRWAVAAVGPGDIDRHNILRGAMDAMAVSAAAVIDPHNSPPKEHVLIDGNQIPPAFKVRLGIPLTKPKTKSESKTKTSVADPPSPPSSSSSSSTSTPGQPELAAECLVGGDGRCYSIAAASVLAKVVRDRIMRDLDQEFPGYDLAQHKGYPTPTHKSIVIQNGPSRAHRLTFAPIKGLWERGADGTPVKAVAKK